MNHSGRKNHLLLYLTTFLLAGSSFANNEKTYFQVRNLLSSTKHCSTEIQRATYVQATGGKATKQAIIDFRCPRELKISWNIDRNFVFFTNGSEAFLVHEPENGKVGKSSVVEHYTNPDQRWLGPWQKLFLPATNISEVEMNDANELFEGYSIKLNQTDNFSIVELLPKEITLPRIKFKMVNDDKIPTEISVDMNKKTYDLVRTKLEIAQEESNRHFIPDTANASKILVLK